MNYDLFFTPSTELEHKKFREGVFKKIFFNTLLICLAKTRYCTLEVDI